MTTHLTLEDLLQLAQDLGVRPVRDIGLLDSAAHRPRTRLWGNDAYASVEEKAAALLQSLLGNHALVDGNKRLGWLAALVFLDLNGVEIDAPDDDAFDFVVSIVDGRLSDTGAIAEVLRGWSVHT